MIEKIFSGLLAFVLIMILAVSPAQAEGQKAILVLDASGSMWGQIEGKTKIEIAREAIAGVLKNWNANDELGLIAYGHRTKGDCNDIETLIPVGKLDQKVFNKAIRQLNPKGKTPLTAAVLQAAEQLKYTEDKATVILVSDGKETCHADPCAAAKEMEKAGVDLTVHVVGFNVVDKKGIRQLRCLAESTGGEYMTASNAAGLVKALDKVVKQVVKQPPATPLGHKFFVSMKEGSEPLTDISNYWYINSAEVDNQGHRKNLLKNGQAQPLFSGLDAGKYMAVVKHGYAQAQTEFEVTGAKDSAVHHLSLNAGYARLKVALTESADPLGKISSYWYIYSVDDQGNRKKIGENGSAQPTLLLPQGKYHMLVKHGYGSAEGDIEVTAGQTTDLSLVLNEGYARLKVALTESADPLGKISSYWYIYSVDDQGNRKKIGENGSAQPTLLLPQGKYHMLVKHGYGSAEGDIEVTAGQTSDLSLVLNEGYARLKVALTEGAEPLDSISSYWYIYSVDDQGNRKKIGENGSAQPTLILPQGKYHAVVDHKHMSIESDFEVTAGHTTDLMLIFPPVE